MTKENKCHKKKENIEEKVKEVKITNFNKHMSKEEREYYGEFFDETR